MRPPLLLTPSEARVLRRAAGLLLVCGGLWAVVGPGWAAVVAGLLVMEPWRAA